MNNNIPINPQLPEQQAFLRGNVEEDRSDLLADDAVQIRGGTWHTTEAG